MAGVNTNAWNRIRYTVVAPVYDRVAPFRRQRRRSVELLDLRAGERVLIVGCGTGLDLEHLPADIDVTAVDITPAMVDRTRTRAESQHRRISADVMDAGALRLADQSFDAVILHLILAVVPDPYAAAREVDRVLVDGGRAVVLDKFVKENRRVSTLRRTLNIVTNTLFSDITRRLSDIVAETGLRILSREDALLGGRFEIALLQKRG